MKRFRGFLSVLLAAMMLASCLPFVGAVDEAAEIYEVEITNDEKQVMNGLGGSIAFNKAHPLHVWSETKPEVSKELMDLMFDEETGIGMDIVRIIIGSGGVIDEETGAQYGNRWYDGPSDTIWPEEGEENIVWNQPDWEEKKASFDPDQIWFCRLAQEYGVHTFYATAWTPPYWMKTNKSAQGPDGAFLRDDCYDDYAKYLMEFALGYYREFGIHITHISATNECESPHSGYDGFIFNGADYTKFVNDYFIPAYEEYAPKFAELGIEPPLICGPEGTNLGVSAGGEYGGMMQNDEVTGFMDVFTTHLYGTANMFENGPQNAPANNWPEWLNNYTLWQTEYMTQNGADSSSSANTQVYKNQTITDACYWANLITNCFTSSPGFSAYLWWWPWGNNGCDGSDLIRAVHNGAGQGDGDTATAMGLYRIFKRFYAFGNFARFVNDGDIRVDATRVPVSGINLSAYKDPTTDEFKIVVVNDSALDRTLSFSFAEDFPLTAEAAAAYRTSASENMALLDAIAIEDGSFIATVPAYTVMTFVPDKGEDNLPGLDFRRDIWSTLEAEDNDGTFGTAATENGLIAADGGFVEFDRVNFADGSANGGIVKRHVLSLRAAVRSYAGGVITAHVDSADGPVVGEICIPAGSGSVYGIYECQINTGDLSAFGIRNLFFTFLGSGDKLFEIDRFEFDEKYIVVNNLLANGHGLTSVASGSASADGWTAEGEIATVTEENYNEPTGPSDSTSAYSFKVNKRAEGSRAFGAVKGKLVEGESYAFNGFFMPGEAKNPDYVIGTPADKTARVEINALDESSAVVYSDVIVERSELETCKWNEMSGSFVFPLAEDEYSSVQLAVYDDSADPFYIDSMTLVAKADKSGLIELLKSEPDIRGLSPRNAAAYESAVSDGWAAVTDKDADLALISTACKNIEKALANGIDCDDIATAEAVAGFNSFINVLDEYDGFAYKAQTFSCRTNAVMRYAFTAPADADASAYTAEFVKGGEGLTIAVTASGSRIIVSVSDITDAQLDDEYVIAISVDGEKIYELTSCPLAYVKAVLNNKSASEELVNFAKSIYACSLAADKYFG